MSAGKPSALRPAAGERSSRAGYPSAGRAVDAGAGGAASGRPAVRPDPVPRRRRGTCECRRLAGAVRDGGLLVRSRGCGRGAAPAHSLATQADRGAGKAASAGPPAVLGGTLRLDGCDAEGQHTPIMARRGSPSRWWRVISRAVTRWPTCRCSTSSPRRRWTPSRRARLGRDEPCGRDDPVGPRHRRGCKVVGGAAVRLVSSRRGQPGAPGQCAARQGVRARGEKGAIGRDVRREQPLFACGRMDRASRSTPPPGWA